MDDFPQEEFCRVRFSAIEQPQPNEKLVQPQATRNRSRNRSEEGALGATGEWLRSPVPCENTGGPKRPPVAPGVPLGRSSKRTVNRLYFPELAGFVRFDLTRSFGGSFAP